MPSKIIRFLLTLSSVAPVGIVLIAGMVYAGDLNWFYLCVIGVPVLIITVIAWLISVFATRRIPIKIIVVEEVRSADKEALGFLLAYALPIIAMKGTGDIRSFNTGALVAFAILAVVVVYRLNLMHVNPLLGLVGFHFYEVLAKSGRTYLFMGKTFETTGADLKVRMLSPDICLEVSSEK